MERLAQGLVHVDYNDPDHVFLVRVEQVKRRRLAVPDDPVAHVGDAVVLLIEATIANHLELMLEVRGEEVDEELRRRPERTQKWIAAGGPERGDSPPTGWASDVMQSLQVVVRDDLRTAYRFASSGGWDSEHANGTRSRLLPTPPVEATSHVRP